MKHCPKAPKEPIKLATFRTTNPSATWDEFKDKASDSYTEVVQQLRIDQSGLCAYCELEISDNNRQVAHFHPKSDVSDPTTNWALSWDNMWLCCKGGTLSWSRDKSEEVKTEQDKEEYMPPLPENRSCDESTTDKILDGKILRPDQVPAFPRIFRYEQQPDTIEIHEDQPLCLRAGIHPDLAHRTIEELNLNCQRLKTARLGLLRLIEQDIKAARKAGVKNLSASDLPAKWLSRQSNRHYRKFFTLIRWRLGQAAEEHLAAIGYQG